MTEIRNLQQAMHNRWMLLGDFNLIYRTSDKSNGRVNRRLMASFKAVIDDLKLKELHLHGR
uniref:Endonuclease/exonuclease/phosphatase domain-containing protein n=1 Tax=Arundo donax TaxID=35708 RepID=A0A0A9ANQ6_ARUDO